MTPHDRFKSIRLGEKLVGAYKYCNLIGYVNHLSWSPNIEKIRRGGQPSQFYLQNNNVMTEVIKIYTKLIRLFALGWYVDGWLGQLLSDRNITWVFEYLVQWFNGSLTIYTRKETNKQTKK